MHTRCVAATFRFWSADSKAPLDQVAYSPTARAASAPPPAASPARPKLRLRLVFTGQTKRKHKQVAMSQWQQAARQAEINRVCSERSHLGQPASAVCCLGVSDDGTHAGEMLPWFNERLVTLCDVSASVWTGTVKGRDMFSAPDSLVFLSAETASIYRRCYEFVERLRGAFLRGLATEAEGFLLLISRLGRATMCYFVVSLVPTLSGVPEGLISLWPTTPSPYSPLTPTYPAPMLIHHAGHAPQTTIAQRSAVFESTRTQPQAEQPQHRSPAPLMHAPPASLSSLVSSFTCRREGRMWHTYKPGKPS